MTNYLDSSIDLQSHNYRVSFSVRSNSLLLGLTLLVRRTLQKNYCLSDEG